jgi:hypothetical protein
VKIIRGYTSNGTFGRWYGDDWPVCYSLERPWLDNAPMVSCVPEGVYELKEYASPKFGDSYVLVNHDLDVGMYEGDAPRYACLIHAANWVYQINGCIAPVTKHVTMKGEWAGSSSGDALRVILNLIEDGDTTLEITHAEGVL